MLTSQTNNGGFYIDVTCPGCGSRLELEENFFVLTCEHCGSVLRIQKPDSPPAYLVRSKLQDHEIRYHIDRFLKQHHLPLSSADLQMKHLYFPYWKVDSLMMKRRNRVYERVVVDGTDETDEISYQQARTEINVQPYRLTLAAGEFIEGIPEMIGMRTNYVKMVPFSRDTIQEDFDSIPVHRNLGEIWQTVQKLVTNVDSMAQPAFGKNLTEVYHPSYELVYFPYIIVENYNDHGFNRYVIDGLSGRIIKHITEVGEEEPVTGEADPTVRFGELKVDFHRCYNCGDDLPDKKSIVYICSNCFAINVVDQSWVKISDINIVDFPESENTSYFPFWSLKISGQWREQLRKLFGGIYDSDRLVVPAFRMGSTEAMYRLARRISASMPKMELKSVEQYHDKFKPVDLRFSDALKYADIFIYREQLNRNPEFSRRVAKVDFFPDEVGLFYAPFHPESYFYVDSALGAVTFEKASIE